jgi:hypothetical protein
MRASISILMVGVCYAGYFSCNKILSDFEKKRSWLKGEIAGISGKLGNLNQKAEELKGSLELWNNIPPIMKEINGLRINEGKEALDKFREKYFLSNLETTFSKPVDLEGLMKVGNAHTVLSNVSIKFGALTDSMVGEFITALYNDFPGILHLKNLSITAGSGLGKQHLKDISNGNFLPLVNSEIQIIWYDIKYSDPVVEEPGMPNNPSTKP